MVLARTWLIELEVQRRERLPGCSASYQHQSEPEVFPCLGQFSTALTFYPKAHYLHCPRELPVTRSAACFLLHIWLFVVLTKEQRRFSLRTSPQTFPLCCCPHWLTTYLPNPEQAPWGGAETPKSIVEDQPAGPWAFTPSLSLKLLSF